MEVQRVAGQELVDGFCVALEEEVAWQKTRGGRPYRLTDGLLLHRGMEGALYHFSLELEVNLPDGTPVRVRSGQREVEGEVVSLRGFDVILMLAGDLGEVVGEAEMISSPWFLLEALQERLRETPLHQFALAMEVIRPREPGEVSELIGSRSVGGRPLFPAVGADGPAEVVRAVARQAITFVWGPPGTGKTESLARLVRDLYEKRQRVLVTAHANVAVDGAVERTGFYLQGCAAVGEVVRYGNARLPSLRRSYLLATNLVAIRHPDLKRRHDELETMRGELITALRGGEKVAGRLSELERALRAVREELKAAEAGIAEAARVVGCTLAKAAIDPVIYRGYFDAVVLDEASMAYIPQVFYAASLARRKMVVIGDFRQLAPVAEAETPAVERWLKREVFDQAGIVRAVDAGRDPGIVLLCEQRRMHPVLSGFVNATVYGGVLRDAPDMAVRRGPIVDREPWPGEPFILVDLSGLPVLCHRERHSRFNPMSALLAATLAGPALGAGLSVALITPYTTQARILRVLSKELYQSNSRLLEGRVFAATVHRFQGGEADVVILDLVDTFPQRSPGKILSSNAHGQAMRLINVALTRARGKLVVMAHRQFLEGRLSDASILRALFAYTDRQGRVVTASCLLKGVLPERIGDSDEGNTASMKWYASRWAALAAWGEDAGSAREIQLDWPGGEGPLDDNMVRILQRTLRRGGRLLIRSGDPAGLPLFLRSYATVHRSCRIACTCFDRRVMWYGFPWPSHARVDSLAARVSSTKICRLMMSLLGMDLREISSNNYRYAGLRAYVEHNLSCPSCSQPLTIRTGRAGKPFLSCTSYRHCGQPPIWITLDLVNAYLSVNRVTCPRGHLLVACPTKRGPRAVCTHRHGCRFSLSLGDLL